MNNKVIYVLVGVIVVLLGVIIFLLFPPKKGTPKELEHQYHDASASVFLTEIADYDITIKEIEDTTEAFIVLASSKTVSKETVYDNVVFQINFQYLETPKEHLDIFVHFDNEINRFYYFSPGVGLHSKHLVGYIDYNTDFLHIGHIQK